MGYLLILNFTTTRGTLLMEEEILSKHQLATTRKPQKPRKEPEHLRESTRLEPNKRKPKNRNEWSTWTQEDDES